MPSKKEIEKALKKEIEIQTVEDKMKEDASWEVGVNKREKAKTQKEIQKQEEKLMKNQKLAELIEQEAVVAAEAVTDEDALPKTKSPFVSVFREEADGKKEKRKRGFLYKHARKVSH